MKTKIFLLLIFIISVNTGISVKLSNPKKEVKEIKTSVKIVKEEKKITPYEKAYNKCTNPKMGTEFTNKCINWELKYK